MTRYVLDASALAEFVAASPLATAIDRVLEDDATLHIPDLCAIEVMSAMRGRVAGRRISAHAASMTIAELVEFPAEVHPSDPLLDRMWQLRGNITTYDAVYVALSEALDAALVTTDRRLARAARKASDIDVVVPG